MRWAEAIAGWSLHSCKAIKNQYEIMGTEMRPKIKIAIPAPTGTEFENFDRLAGILAQLRPATKIVFPKRKPAAPALEVSTSSTDTGIPPKLARSLSRPSCLEHDSV